MHQAFDLAASVAEERRLAQLAHDVGDDRKSTVRLASEKLPTERRTHKRAQLDAAAMN